MGKKEDKKDKSKGLVYVTNGETKTPGGLPDPEMTVPSDDASSEGLPTKSGRRCGRYRCPIITISVLLVIAAVACAVYFSVSILVEEEKKLANSSTAASDQSRGDALGSVGQGQGENNGGSTVTVSSTTTFGSPDFNNAGSLMRGGPGMGSLLRGIITEHPPDQTTSTTKAPNSDQDAAENIVPPSLALRRRSMILPPPSVNGTESGSAENTDTSGGVAEAAAAVEGPDGSTSHGTGSAGETGSAASDGGTASAVGDPVAGCVDGDAGQASDETGGCVVAVAVGSSGPSGGGDAAATAA